MAALYWISTDDEDSDSDEEVAPDISGHWTFLDISDFLPNPNKNLKNVREVLDEDKFEPTGWYINYYQLVRDIQPYLKDDFIIKEAKGRVVEDLGLQVFSTGVQLFSIVGTALSPEQRVALIFDDRFIDFRPKELLEGITDDYLSEYLALDEHGTNFNAFGPAERLFVRYIYEIASQARDLKAYTIASESDRGNFARVGPDLAQEIKKFIGKKKPKTKLRF